MAAAYISYRFKLRAEIGGFKFPDVIQFTSHFAMNSIPRATLLLPVGRRVDTLEAAAIHAVAGDLRTRQPASVWLDVEKLGSDGKVVDHLWGGEKKIFEGYATGLGWRRATGGAQLVVGLLHWLSDLHYASAMSGSSHPGNPENWSYGAAFRSGPGGAFGAGGGGQVGWIPIGGTPLELSDQQILAGLWDGVFKPWFTELTENDPIDQRLAINDENRLLGGAAPNEAILDAIGKIKQRNLTLREDLFASPAVLQAIRMFLSRTTWQTWVHTTLWGKLVGEFAPQFRFAISPRIEDALLVPTCGGVRRVYKTLVASDENMLEANTAMPQVLGNVGVLHPSSMEFGGRLADSDDLYSPTELPGLYPTEVRQGLKLLKRLPHWMSEISLSTLYSNHSTGDAGTKPIGTAFHGPEDVEPEPEEIEKPEEAQKQVPKLADAFARQWYIDEALKGRYGELSGPLRFDICPGSSIQLESGGSRFIPEDGVGTPLFAEAMGVSIVINSQQQRAGTSFNLAHIRNEEENGDDDWSIDSPPLYVEPFLGSTLFPDGEEGEEGEDDGEDEAAE